MKAQILILVAVSLLVASLAQAGPALDSLLQSYQTQGVSHADAEAGKRFWNERFMVKGEARQCASCHTREPRNAGKHTSTGKPIEPMAPSVNAERLTDIDKINKWFKRNCKWTLGRECTAQEQADVLVYLKDR